MKKGQGLSLNVIILAAIALFVVVIIIILAVRSGNASGCPVNADLVNGKCVFFEDCIKINEYKENLSKFSCNEIFNILILDLQPPLKSGYYSIINSSGVVCGTSSIYFTVKEFENYYMEFCIGVDKK